MAAAPAPDTTSFTLSMSLADELQAIADRRRRDDGRAVLVIVEHGDVHALGKLALDVEALRRLECPRG